MRVYDKRINKVIHYANEVPQEILDKRDYILPVVITKEKIQDTETPKKEAGEYLTDTEYTIHKVIKYHVDTLEEAKEKKVIALKSYVASKFPKDYKQRSASLGVYTEKENNRITNEVQKWYNYIEGFEQQILDCSTIEELELIDYRTEEDKAQALLDDEMMI